MALDIGCCTDNYAGIMITVDDEFHNEFRGSYLLIVQSSKSFYALVFWVHFYHVSNNYPSTALPLNVCPI